MQRYEVRIVPSEGKSEVRPFILDAPSLRTALIVADINIGGGTAEIWLEQRRLARMRKAAKGEQTLWKLG